MKKPIRLWVPVLIYIGMIFWVSSSYHPIPGIQYFPWMDKICHLIEYTPLGGLLTRAISGSWSRLGKRSVFLGAFLVAVSVGLSDEFYQRFIPMKFSSIWDVAADAVGASIGQFLYSFRRARTP